MNTNDGPISVLANGAANRIAPDFVCYPILMQLRLNRLDAYNRPDLR